MIFNSTLQFIFNLQLKHAIEDLHAKEKLQPAIKSKIQLQSEMKGSSKLQLFKSKVCMHALVQSSTCKLKAVTTIYKSATKRRSTCISR
jgi:hypothetical protein